MKTLVLAFLLLFSTVLGGSAQTLADPTVFECYSSSSAMILMEAHTDSRTTVRRVMERGNVYDLIGTMEAFHDVEQTDEAYDGTDKSYTFVGLSDVQMTEVPTTVVVFSVDTSVFVFYTLNMTERDVTLLVEGSAEEETIPLPLVGFTCEKQVEEVRM